MSSNFGIFHNVIESISGAKISQIYECWLHALDDLTWNYPLFTPKQELIVSNIFLCILMNWSSVYGPSSVTGLILSDNEIKKGLNSAEAKIRRRNYVEAIESDPIISDKPGVPPGDSNLAGERILHFMQNVCNGNNKNCDSNDIQDFTGLMLIDELKKFCRKEIFCSDNSRKYRNYDGKCNNLVENQSLFGSVGTPLGRIIFPAYDDGISNPRRKSVVPGKFLKPTRFISDKVLQDIPNLDTAVTTLNIYFGQTITHDNVETKVTRLDGERLSCCGTPSGKQRHQACFPINIRNADSFYGTFGVGCMDVARSMATVSLDCKFDVRQQENGRTPFIDASFLYGSSEGEAIVIREKVDGKMKTSAGNVLPLALTPECVVSGKCVFIGGDGRGNQNPPLVLINIVFMREHNRIAGMIKTAKPSWGDEKIYQETRKIVTAMFQSITWRRYVPEVIGSAAMSYYGLEISNTPSKSTYDPNLRPEILNSFTTAAFRFGHGTVTTDINLEFDNGTSSSIKFKDGYFEPFALSDNNILTAMARGLVTQNPRKASVFMASSVSKQLYNSGGKRDFAGDLGAVNIQRGRDHGLPSYNEFREHFGLPKLTKFSDFPVSGDTLTNIKKAYDDIDDVDLFPGGLLEEHIADASVGPLFSNIMGKQFRILMKGDRFFYNNGNRVGDAPELIGHQFTNARFKGFFFMIQNIRLRDPLTSYEYCMRRTRNTDSLLELSKFTRKTKYYLKARLNNSTKPSMARMLCDNTGIGSIQRNAFKNEGPGNPVVSCASIKKMNFNVIINGLPDDL
ncbi:Chorion peroxidase [Nymphon striatum]|nr:Chorion peroxidase [Nymphon striatum]